MLADNIEVLNANNFGDDDEKECECGEEECECGEEKKDTDDDDDDGAKNDM